MPDSPTMPDPLHLLPEDPGDQRAEVPIHEVLSMIATALGGPITEYINAEAENLTPQKRHLLLQSLTPAVRDLDILLATWDALCEPAIKAAG